MCSISSRVGQLFENCIYPIRISLLVEGQINGDLQCVFSSLDREPFKEGSRLSIYDLPSLLRVLGTKTGIFNDELIKKIGEDHQEICQVLVWKKKKKVVVIHLKELKLFDPELLTKKLEEERENIISLFPETGLKIRNGEENV